MYNLLMDNKFALMFYRLRRRVTSQFKIKYNHLRMGTYVKKVRERIKVEEYSDLFTTWQVMEDCGYVDFLFIGEHKGKPVVWNACITTAKGDYYEKVNELAHDEAYDAYPNPDDYNFMDSFVKIEGTNYSEMIDPDPELSDNRYALMSKRTIEILNAKEVSIPRWNIEIDEEYEYGIGLHVRLDVDVINTPDVEWFIEQFEQEGIAAFDSMKRYYNDELSLTAEELGVELKEDRRFVSWVDEDFRHNDVAIKNGIFNEDGDITE